MMECEAPIIIDTPPIIGGGGDLRPMHDFEQGDGGGLTRTLTARTSEFVNHRRVDAQRADLRSKVHRERLDRYGPGAVVHGQSLRFQIGMSDTIGHRRTMEDCMTLSGCFRGDPGEDIFAVFDGHGGQAVAEYAAMNVTRVLQDVADANAIAPATEILSLAFQRLNGYVAADLGDEALESGTTAALVWVQRDALHVANVGDSRAVLGRNGLAERLSVDHKPDVPGRFPQHANVLGSPFLPLIANQGTVSTSADTVVWCCASFGGRIAEERERIERLGGTVVNHRGIARLDGSLAVSRSLGDLASAPMLSCEPSCASISLEPSDR